MHDIRDKVREVHGAIVVIVNGGMFLYIPLFAPFGRVLIYLRGDIKFGNEEVTNVFRALSMNLATLGAFKIDVRGRFVRRSGEAVDDITRRLEVIEVLSVEKCAGPFDTFVWMRSV